LHLVTGKIGNGDEELRQIAEYMFKHGGYIPRHPLTRNWWSALKQSWISFSNCQLHTMMCWYAIITSVFVKLKLAAVNPSYHTLYLTYWNFCFYRSATSHSV